MPRTLASHPDYLVTFHEGRLGTDGPLVVTFGGQPSKRTPTGFGTEWCQKHGWDSIYVAQRADTQYQDLSIEVFRDAVTDICDGRDVVCYGASLGAYAAIFYGGSINARIVASSPMLPAWPPLGRHKHMIPIKHGSIADGPISSHDPILLYDPHLPPDCKVVEELVLPAYPNARHLHFAHAGHMVLELLASAGAVSKFMKPIIQSGEVVEMDFDFTQSVIWNFHRGRHLRMTDPVTARTHFERALEIEPGPHIVGNLLSHYMRQQDKDAAQSLINWVSTHDSPKVRVPTSNINAAKAFGLDTSPLV